MLLSTFRLRSSLRTSPMRYSTVDLNSIFFCADWTKKDEDEKDLNVWEDNWDDDNLEDDFSVQLR